MIPVALSGTRFSRPAHPAPLTANVDPSDYRTSRRCPRPPQIAPPPPPAAHHSPPSEVPPPRDCTTALDPPAGSPAVTPDAAMLSPPRIPHGRDARRHGGRHLRRRSPTRGARDSGRTAVTTIVPDGPRATPASPTRRQQRVRADDESS
ncbi:hypothetical protein PVAP13_3NG178418 [Panicum virgatum]|uniref:Uncharacterized protein n=1 Tax=Panicum virgatum TaxID=38727 RepID=A0A8T0U9V6_PANVG|nr:hypothetical protein PVAP13_3NG178418 [Panicum virgatum]